VHRLLANTPLRLILVIPFVAQISAAVGLTAWLSIRNGQQAVDDVANDLWTEITARTEQHITEYTQIPQDVIDDTIANQQLNLANLQDPNTLTQYLWHQMQTHEELFITAVGYETGEIVGVGVEEDGQLVIRAMAPGQTQLQTYAISGAGNRGSGLRANDFDLKSRPWYRDAVDAGTLIWTEIYPNYAPPFNILSAASPIYDAETGELIGVTNATLALWQISDFLEGLEVGQSGQIFIIERNGNLVAASTGENLSPIDPAGGGGTRKRLNVLDSRNPRVRQTAAHLMEQFGDLHRIQEMEQTTFWADGEREIVQVTPFSDDLGLDWLMVTVVPESDFMAQIYVNTRNTIWLVMGALVLATGSSILTARWITRPLLQLNQAAKDVTQRSLDSEPLPMSQPPITNRTREVSELTRSFSQMTQQLQSSFAALQESEAAFKDMAAGVPGAIIRYVLHPDGSDAVAFMNPGCCQLWEIEAEAAEQDVSVLWQIVHPEDLPAMQASVMESARTLQTWNHEWRITTPSGRQKWLEATGQPTRQPDGSVLWYTVILDVSERKQAELALEQELLLSKTLFDTSIDGIVLLDIQGNVLQASEAFAQMLGYTMAEMSRLNVADWDAQWNREELQAILDGTLPLSPYFETRHRRKDGSIYEVEISSSRAILKEETVLLCLCRDITERKQAEAERTRLTEALEASLNEIYLFDGDTLRFEYANQGALQNLGYTLQQIQQMTPVDIKPELSAAEFASLLAPLRQGDVPKINFETVHQRADGSYYPVDVHLQLTQHIEKSVFLAIILDISHHKQAEAQLQDLAERLAMAVQAADMGIWEWDIVNDHLHWDEQMFELYQVRPEDFGQGNNAWQARVHPDDLPAIDETLQKALAGEQDYVDEFRILWPDGTIRHIASYALVQRDAEGRPLRMVGANLDISDRKQAEAQIIYSALHDALTDLPNRTLLTSRLELAIQRAQRSSNYHFAVMFLDLDQFKVINDSLGHLIGDKLLLTVAQKLQSIIRPTDLAARLGGDEFVILLEHVPDIAAVIHMAERLLAEFETVTVVEGHSVFITTSIGIVWGSQTYTEATDLLRDADIALYRAKAQGRNRYEIFDVEMHVQAMKRMTLEHDLRIAIERQEFITYYQPIVELKTSQLLGFEALIRWRHPRRGFISPGDFIPVAEETGLIMPITQWMLQSACEQLVIWQHQFPNRQDLRVSVNLSSQDLRQTTLVETISQILHQARLSPHSLTLEITESMLVENTEDAITLLGQLRDLGIRISIDDFGTGYSSLSYLYTLPADYLKIDQSFVGNMQARDKNYKIVQAVVSLSDQLQLATIAEGIETEQQLAWLKDLGCELGQGYLFSRPLPADAVSHGLAMGSILQR
jgi:diguanylate cyclase (GGDEF)-like protein/PAS domain S-box-containing protein